jgi:MFS family permease
MSMQGSLRMKLSRYDRQVWMLFAAEIVNVFGTSIIRTFLAIYMFQTMHIPMFWVGVALFVSSLAGVVFAYVGGSLADAYGRKKILVAGLLLQIVAYLLISLAIDAGVPYFLFVIVLTVSSLIQGLYRTVPDVMIADAVESGKRVEAYALLRVEANLGWVIGPVLGGSPATDHAMIDTQSGKAQVHGHIVHIQRPAVPHLHVDRWHYDHPVPATVHDNVSLCIKCRRTE